MQKTANAPAAASGYETPERLPYSIELWQTNKIDTVERVLARAFNLHLAQAIFAAATEENPRRRITIGKGTRIIADTHGKAD